MKTRALISSIAMGTALLLSAQAPAQQAPRLELPQPSPSSTLKQRVGLTDIEISYSRPSARDRLIFGGLVPYGQVWRTGANARTTISFSTPVKLNGTEIPAGKYALFTIPGESDWTIILNKNTKSSALSYDASNDVARISVPSTTISEDLDTFTILISEIRDDSARIDLVWEHTAIPISLTTDLVDTLAPKIEATMSAPGERKPYYQAAMFYYDHGLDLKKAKAWIEQIKPDQETYYNMNLKARILAKLGEKDAAIAAAKRSSELTGQEPGGNGYLKLNQELIDSLK